MKLVLGSDLHGNLPPVPSCDILILAGDILPETDQEIFIENNLRPWLNQIPAGYKIATWGNHDHKPFRQYYWLPWILLVDKAIVIRGFKFYGTPWCLPIGRWAWQAPEYVLEKIYEMIPNDTDILISHCPPYLMRDKADSDPIKRLPSGNVGSRALRERMEKLSNFKLLACGHIHEARGRDGKVMNVSCIDRQYKQYPEQWTIVEI